MNSVLNRACRLGALSLMILVLSSVASAWVGGSISGTVKDSSGGVIPGATVTVTNTALGTEFKVVTDARGYYSFPNLAVGKYELNVDASGFKPQKKTGLVLDVDGAIEVTTSLEVRDVTTDVSVSATVDELQVAVETISTQLGDVVSSTQMTTIPPSW